MKNNLKTFCFAILCVALIACYFVSSKISLANDEVIKEANQETNQEEFDTTITQEISKYMELENTTIVEQKINIGMVNENNNSRESEIISTLVPNIHGNKLESWYVILDGKKLEDEKYDYNEENRILRIINTQNDEQVEKEEWQNGENEYKIVYIYQKGEEIEKTDNEEQTVLRTVVGTKLYGQEAVIKNDEKQVGLSATGNLAEMSQTIEGELYKGYLYANLNREIEIKEKNELEIVNANLLESIVIQDAGTVIGTALGEEVGKDEEQVYDFNSNITYKRTVISKSDIDRILGNEGKIVLKDENGNELANIDSKTEANEDGNVYIEYASEIHLLQIEIINPQTEGSMWITHIKKVNQQTNAEKEILQSLVTMQHKNNIVTNYTTSQTEANIELKETTIQNNLQICKESLSTSASNDIEIQLTLLNNNEKYDLYENPVIEIVLPEEVQNIEVTAVDLLYEQEMRIKNVLKSERIIKIELEGAQTDYKDGSIEGAVVSVKAKIDLNKLSVNATKEIIAKVTNKGKTAESKKQIEITSPRDIITVNNIENLGIQTVGEEKTVATEMAKGDKSKNLEVKSAVINNNGESIENVEILGDFGTNGAVTLEDKMLENNLGVSVISPINVEGAEAKVYYTQNFNATDDLQNSENGWSESTENLNTASKYLVIIDKMEKDASVNLSYGINVPENLDYNMQAYEGYNVSYKAVSAENENSATSTYVELTTGLGAEIETNITAVVGATILQNNDKVKQGEVIKYVLQVTNTGTLDATDITLKGNVPEGTVAVEPIVDAEYSDGSYYQELNNKTEYTFEIDSLPIGESAQRSFEVRVKSDAQEATNISNKSIVSYGEVTKESETLTNEVENGSVRISIKSTLDSQTEVTQNDLIQYQAIIENLTDEDIEGLVLEWNITDGFTIKDNRPIHSYDMNYNGSPTLNLNTLPANGSIVINMLARADKLENGDVLANITAKVIGDKEYRSNVLEEPILSKANIDLELSATKTGEYLKPGDNITYTIRAVSKNSITTSVYLEDEISSYLSILSIKVNGVVQNSQSQNENETLGKIEGYTVKAQKTLEPGEELTLEINTVVNANDNLNEIITITNQAVALVSYVEKKSNTVTHYIEYETQNGNEGENPSGNNKTYYLSGKAWLDENEDGEMQDNEQGLSGIKVYLQDTSSGELIKDKNGNTITQTTSANGEYRFSNLESKNYITIFDYNSSKYRLTTYQKEGVESSRNSKAIEKRFSLDSYEKTYGVTDEIEITNRSVANINIGLIESDTFDMALTKTVQKVTVQTPSKTNVYGFSNVNLAKVELSRKDSENVGVTIQYAITVINNGEIEGYAKKIVDYIPQGFEIANESKQTWTKEGDLISSTVLTNEVIRPGESKTINLVLTKNTQEEATGTYSNTAEIAQIYNEQGIDDINSVPGNKVSSEDDIDTAEVIISIGTGRAIWYITLIASIILIIGIGVYLIKTKVLGKEEIDIEKK